MAITSVYSVIAVWMPVTSVPTSSATVAIATFITDVSSVIRNWPDANVISTGVPRSPLTPRTYVPRACAASSDPDDADRPRGRHARLVQDALIFAFTAALNPTLFTATMVMLFAPEPRRLMSGYLVGAYTVSITLGLVIVFAL